MITQRPAERVPAVPESSRAAAGGPISGPERARRTAPLPIFVIVVDDDDEDDRRFRMVRKDELVLNLSVRPPRTLGVEKRDQGPPLCAWPAGSDVWKNPGLCAGRR